MYNSLQPHGLHNPWNSLVQNIVVGSLFLLQGIFPTQESNPGPLHYRQILYRLNPKGSPMINHFKSKAWIFSVNGKWVNFIIKIRCFWCIFRSLFNESCNMNLSLTGTQNALKTTSDVCSKCFYQHLTATL